MKTLIICPSVAQAKQMEGMYFPHPDDGRNDTICIGAGAGVMGYHFHRFVWMPGWDIGLRG